MNRSSAILVAAGLFLPVASIADEDAPREILKEAGLKKIGVYYVLPAEEEVATGLKELKPFERRLQQAVEMRERFDAALNQTRVALQQALFEHLRLTNMLAYTDDVDDHNEIVMRMNFVAGRITALHGQIQSAPGSEQVGKALSDAGRDYVQAVDALRQKVQQAQTRYEKLAADAAVTAALDTLRQDTRRPFKLGPRDVFTKDVARVEELAAAVETSVLSVDRRGDILLVDAVVNDKVPVRMVFDTGASSVLLPATTAREAGIVIDERTPVVQSRVADGRIIESRLVLLESLRVGPFTVENVECIVLPPDMTEASALLGGSFLRHFQVEVNHDAGEVRLTRVNAPPPTKRGR